MLSSGVRVWVEPCYGSMRLRLRLGEADSCKVGIDLIASITVALRESRFGARLGVIVICVVGSSFVCARKTNI